MKGDHEKAAEILRQFSAGAATTADIATRAQMGVEEIHGGSATDPFTGQKLVHRGGMAPVDSGMPALMLPWWKRPLWGNVPTYVYLGGAGLVVGAVLLRRRG